MARLGGARRQMSVSDSLCKGVSVDDKVAGTRSRGGARLGGARWQALRVQGIKTWRCKVANK